MAVDRVVLLNDLKKQVRQLEDDVRRQAGADGQLSARLRAEHAQALEVGRTATAYTAWLETQLTQAAVAWVLGSVFVRFCEDNGLVEDAWITGRGSRGRLAGERQRAFFLQQPMLNDRDWLLAGFEHLTSFPAVASLFDKRHNPLFALPVSGDGAEALISFWRRTDADGELLHDFADPDLSTRFLGDLYQDLSEAARKQFALLQTPDFVEEFILDLTLDPAIEEFGLDGLKMIDPTCGSGHFLLGAFHRLLDRSARESPGLDVRERVQKVLDSVHGVDVNPFATAIAKFRLTIAALQATSVETLAVAPGFTLHVATGDSLLWEQGRQDELFDSALADHLFASEDLDEHPGILRPGTYHAVVGNPPYITVKDKALNEAYRKAYPTCSGKYALSVPFAELFFRLAVSDGTRAGFVGQITSNSFMKREFGKKLIERYFQGRDLQFVIDTSGAYIPGHGTPTVILVGRNRHASKSAIRTVLGIRGEPSAPAVPAKGVVWTSIVDHVNEAGFENAYVSVVDLPRDRMASHPWSLSGGGADEVRIAIESARTVRLGDVAFRIGVFGIMGVDDAMMVTDGYLKRKLLESELHRPVVAGDLLRDWGVAHASPTFFPYDDAHQLEQLDEFPRAARALWPFRTEMGNRTTFSKRTYFDEGRPWFEWHQLPVDKGACSQTITFAFVATHNHFVLDRGGKVFKQSAPVIKLPEGATEEEHLELLGVLNSSTACFWLKQVSHNKGEGGGARVDAGYSAMGSESWKDTYEFTGTKLQQFPLPPRVSASISGRLDELQQELASNSPVELMRAGVPDRVALASGRNRYESLQRQMIFWQEELDWDTYRAYGLVDCDFIFGGNFVEIELGERTFEIVMARKMAQGELETAWFTRHGSNKTVDVPKSFPPDYADLVGRRVSQLESNPSIEFLERPEYKRKWASETWERMETAALRDWLLDRLEARELWFDRNSRPRMRSVAQLADELAADVDFSSVLSLWAGTSAADPAVALVSLLRDEHVPFLAALRLKESGLRSRQAWEETWDLQRREDAGEDVGSIPVPPKYKPIDFLKSSFWKHRGKLDVPKERFVSYPGAERGADTSLVVGWAGWDHAEQALALAAYALERVRTDSWGSDRLVPLWAGVAELEPWVRQWHGEVDARIGSSPAGAVAATLEQELARLQITRDDLAAWRPPASTRGRRRTTTQEG